MESPILIVDDEADIRSLLEINLRREGYETVSAASAAEDDFTHPPIFVWFSGLAIGILHGVWIG